MGYEWLDAGWSKITNPAGVWVGAKAGTVSTNPLLFILATWLVLAWRVAGYWGLDRWALPLLGVPGAPGTLFQRGITATPEGRATMSGRGSGS